MLSAVLEEEADLYEAFPPHVDPSGITILSESPPGILLVFSKLQTNNFNVEGFAFTYQLVF